MGNKQKNGIKTFQKLKRNAAINTSLKRLNDDELKRLQKCLLAMLDDFHSLCLRNNLRYFLTGGNALGLERNQGFIPWDDDIDVIMPREDYEKLAECVQREMSESYWVQGLETSAVHDLNFLKFRKLGTKYIELFEPEPDKAGICIDVFPLDNVYDNKLKAFLYGLINEGLYLAASCVRMHQKKDRLLLYINDESLTKAIRLKSFIGSILDRKSNPRFWYILCEKWSKMVKENQSKKVVVSCGRGHYFGEQYEKDRIFPLKESNFEGHKVLTANDNVYLVKVLYGSDYMTPHPAGEREAHSLLELDFGEG